MYVEVRDALAHAIIGRDERSLRVHRQLDCGGKRARIREQRLKHRIRQVGNCLEMSFGNHETMPGEQRPMIQKRNRVLIFKNSQAVIILHNFAEDAVVVKRERWCLHVRCVPVSLKKLGIR